MISYLTTYTHYSIPVSDSNLFLLFGTEIALFLENEIKTQICDESDGNCTKIQTIIPSRDWIKVENSMLDYGLLIGARYLINSIFRLEAPTKFHFTEFSGLIMTGSRFRAL